MCMPEFYIFDEGFAPLIRLSVEPSVFVKKKTFTFVKSIARDSFRNGSFILCKTIQLLFIF